jgi:hypothetical protein
MAKQLKHYHPLSMKLLHLEVYLDANLLSVEWDGIHLIITDKEANEQAYIKDKESGENITELPYITETKLIKKE